MGIISTAPGNKREKKGIFFTIDAILAVSIILGVLFLLTTFYISEQPRISLEYISSDIITVLSQMKVSEIDNAYVQQLIANGSIIKLDNSLLDQIGEFWAEGNYDLAHDLAQNVTEPFIPPHRSYALYIERELIYMRNLSGDKDLSISSKLISGIAKNQTINGVISQSYLLSKQRKRAESYSYFGGFEGQGNLTKTILDIPSDANISSMVLEAFAGDNFNLYVNGVKCLGDFSKSPGNMTALRWDISTCNGSVIKGAKNEFKIRFLGALSASYIGGGYIKVKYFTEQQVNQDVYGNDTYIFPGVEGILNVYSSINIPGILTSWRANLTFYNNYSTFLVIGNETVMNRTGSSSLQSVYIERNNLSYPPGTLPIRMGVINVTVFEGNTSGSPSESILSTDVSGSMDDCAQYVMPYRCNYQCIVGGSKSCVVSGPSVCVSPNKPCGGSCWFPTNYYMSCQATKLSIAKDADKVFVNTVLNYSGNSLGLNSYSTNLVNSLSPTTDNATLISRINSYTSSGNTCICCGINSAIQLLAGSTKDKTIVIMSDGEANMYCDNINDVTGGSGTALQAKNAAIYSGQYACNNSIDVYAVGFGYDADHATLSQIACNASMYYNATNVSQLGSIYAFIATQIGMRANYSAQLLNVSGNIQYATLYPNSSIQFTYTPVIEPPKFGELQINLDAGTFKNCTPQFYVYSPVTITDAKLTSYSSSFWTNEVNLNGINVWNLTKFGTDYTQLGDPFVVQLPPNLIKSGQLNNLSIKTGDSPTNSTGCSSNNSLLVYRGTVRATSSQTSVMPRSEGCNWTVTYEDASAGELMIPTNYDGDKQCFYTPALIDYDHLDAIDLAAYDLLRSFDFDNDSRLDVNINEMDLVFGSMIVPQVPSLWGPSIVEVQVW